MDSQPAGRAGAQRSGPRAHIGPRTSGGWPWLVWAILILVIGVLARAWEFGHLPPGLNSDEASIGVEAWNLSHFGEDRNGLSWPVHFIAWGSGQNALYGYALVPFVGALGLRPVVVRLPMLITGILSLPIMYLVGAGLWGKRTGLLAGFLLAISPWHILLSRWGLESNIFPFVFLLGFVCLLRLRERSLWFIGACGLFGLCMYAYGTAYVVVPVFVAGSLLLLARRRIIGGRLAAQGVLAFGFVAAPIILMLIVNAFALPQIHLGPFTIPRFPVAARYETASLVGAAEPARTLFLNLQTAARLLLTESDGLAYNVVEPYGVLYHLCLILGLIGIVVAIREAHVGSRWGVHLLAIWLGSSALIAALQAVNINRFNIAFLPLLLFAAYAMTWLLARSRVAFGAALAVLLMAFLLFTRAYHGDKYRQLAAFKFNDGLVPALQFASNLGIERLCVTDKVTMPYIFALFADPIPPKEFVATVRYVDATEPLRRVASFGAYTFGTRNCTGEGPYAYVLTSAETPPRLGNRYVFEFFEDFVVYYPAR